MAERTCKTPFIYGGAARKAGERFEVEAAHLEVLVGTGHIEREETDRAPSFVAPHQAAYWPASSPEAAGQAYETRELRAGVGSRRSGLRAKAN